MNAKTKLLFGAVTLICLLSLVFNGILLGRGNSSASEVSTSALSQMDSLKSVIAQMDTVINTQKEEIQAAQSAAVSSNGELTEKVKRHETEITNLKGQITKKTEENKKLREEIDQLKKDKTSGGKTNKRRN